MNVQENFDGSDEVESKVVDEGSSFVSKAGHLFVQNLFKTREQVLKFGGYAIPGIILYNAAKVAAVTGFGVSIMNSLGFQEDSKQVFESASVAGVLGASTTLHVGIWIVGEKVYACMKKHGGDVVFKDFIMDETS